VVPALHETLLAARAEREQPPIGHMTPHTLRRKFASILAEVGVPPRRAMYLLGHNRPDAHDPGLPAGARHGRGCV